ncbi:hypothetical protein IF1G_10092 [Cordyceps javanica]|uniref:Uncharacterized protein n=1 Tax=Cordyceps javanica TaxID=43265 RepID=A0A545UP23_9HYPO|nr:hypothetical protein IF1G_10092 [Cordyceps javanica]TQW02998.1 hypothetical protein IF2G_09515 [Cordyceps javanica]
MRYLSILAIPSILAAANPLLNRQLAQNAADASTLLTLRANYCIDYGRPDCQEKIARCNDESKVMEDCIRDEHPECIKDETSYCSKAVAQCVADSGEEEDADSYVRDCMIEELMLGYDDEPEPTETGDEQVVPSSPSEPERVAACRKASAEYIVARLNDDCDEESNEIESADRGSNSLDCELVGATFRNEWAAHDCDTVLSV